MPHAAFATGQMVDEVGAHGRPTQAGAINDGFVELARGGHPVVHQMQDFAPQRFLQAIGQVPRHLASHVQGMHPDEGKEFGGHIDGALHGFIPANQLDQGQQIDRIEGMGHQEALRRNHIALQIAGRETRGARGDDDVRGSVPADLRQHALLQRQLLRDIFLDEIGLPRHHLKIRGERQFALRRQGRGGQARQSRLGVGHRAANPFFHFRFDVGSDDVHPEMQRARGPSAADDAGSEQAKCLYIPHHEPRRRHEFLIVTIII